jgi:hypothetical protein
MIDTIHWLCYVLGAILTVLTDGLFTPPVIYGIAVATPNAQLSSCDT